MSEQPPESNQRPTRADLTRLRANDDGWQTRTTGRKFGPKKPHLVNMEGLRAQERADDFEKSRNRPVSPESRPHQNTGSNRAKKRIPPSFIPSFILR